MVYDNIRVETGNKHDSITVDTLPLEEEEGGNSSFSEATDDNLVDVELEGS